MSLWSKEVKKTLIDRDMSVAELADKLGYRRSHMSAVVNGILISKPARDKVSEYLGLPAEYSDDYWRRRNEVIEEALKSFH